MADRLTEEDIRPADLFAGYLELVAKDVQAFFAHAERKPLPCPACDGAGAPAFTKLGFDYRECSDCNSLWVSPRPGFATFAAFYSESESSRYWADVFSPAVAEVRRERLWRPKARRVADISAALSVASAPFQSLVDIGGGTGVFAEEYAAIDDVVVVVVEPGPTAAEACRRRGINVVEAFLEDLRPEQMPDGPTVFTSFELFEHVHDPFGWLSSVASVMKPGDVFVMTTLSGTGLDIRVLWDQSASVNPPHHINFLNPTAMRALSARCGLEALDIFTPGELDIDILRNNASLVQDRFWSMVIESDEDARGRWQALIAEGGGSSHMWAVLRKPMVEPMVPRVNG